MWFVNQFALTCVLPEMNSMRAVLVSLLLAVCICPVFAQTTTVNVGITTMPFDSSYVIQTGQVDSFHAGNHPGAGPYQNGEIVLCANSTLKYNFTMGTSSGPSFYLEPHATLILYGDFADAKIYMKDSAKVLVNGYTIYIAQVKRVASAAVLNASATSNYLDSVFAAVNFTFNSWPGAVSPCSSPTKLINLNESEDLTFYPNPASTYIQLNQKLQGNFELEIFDVTGKRVIYQNMNSTSNVDVSMLANSVYHYLLTSETNRLRGRFLKN